MPVDVVSASVQSRPYATSEIIIFLLHTQRQNSFLRVNSDFNYAGTTARVTYLNAISASWNDFLTCRPITSRNLCLFTRPGHCSTRPRNKRRGGHDSTSSKAGGERDGRASGRADASSDRFPFRKRNRSSRWRSALSTRDKANWLARLSDRRTRQRPVGVTPCPLPPASPPSPPRVHDDHVHKTLASALPPPATNAVLCARHCLTNKPKTIDCTRHCRSYIARNKERNMSHMDAC